jgi:hypothetical protein
MRFPPYRFQGRKIRIFMSATALRPFVIPYILNMEDSHAKTEDRFRCHAPNKMGGHNADPFLPEY